MEGWDGRNRGLKRKKGRKNRKKSGGRMKKMSKNVRADKKTETTKMRMKIV